MDSKIALIEDDDLIAGMVELNLRKSGSSVIRYEDGEHFLPGLNKNNFDLIILDIMLPGISGVEILRKVREQGLNIPVLMMTAKTDLQTKVGSLNIGADDYIHKPFSMEELVARARALIRRSRSERMIPTSRILLINGFRVDMDSRVSESNHGNVVLSEKEIRFLEFLAARGGEPQKRADILEEVWGMDVSPTPRTIDNFILKFRKLFENDPAKPDHFISVRNKGYAYIE